MIQLHPFEESATSIPYQYRHSRLIGALVLWLEPETIVEVGTHIGATAVWIARALQLLGKGRLYCIDPWCWTDETQEEQWEANLQQCGVRDFVTHLRGRSEEVTWPEKVDFAYIDGNHTYPICKHDTEKAKALGATCIVLHDTVSWEGSRKYSEQIRMEIDGTHDQEYGRGESEWEGWDVLEDVREGGLMILLKRGVKGACEGVDAGEQWDKPTEEVEKRRRGRPRKQVAA